MTISEIMYDAPGSDAGHEWIEIFNDGSASVSIADWRLLEGGVKHKLAAVSGGDSVQPGQYAIIADNPENFRTDFPDFNGQLFDSAFSLSNTGETLKLLNAEGATAVSVSYQGTAGDGNSLNKSGNEFVARTPTPGASISSSAITSPPKETTTTKQKKETAAVVGEDNAVEAIPQTEVVPKPERIVAVEQQTAAVVFSRASIIWWAAALVIAIAAGGALLYARSLKGQEWDIVEEQG